LNHRDKWNNLKTQASNNMLDLQVINLMVVCNQILYQCKEPKNLVTNTVSQCTTLKWVKDWLSRAIMVLKFREPTKPLSMLISKMDRINNSRIYSIDLTKGLRFNLNYILLWAINNNHLVHKLEVAVIQEVL
jgi:hypothetical protein